MPAARVSQLAQGLEGSAILQIASEVRALLAQGREIANLTVGDFSSAQFRIPRQLEDGIVEALRSGESTYPPPNGLEALRTAVGDFYRRRLGLDYPNECILITSGARPAIYSLYRAVVDRGDRVVFGTPSWNNDHYSQIVGAESVTIECDASTGFLPTADLLRPVIRGARLLALNSPLNPTGTLFSAEQLAAICDLVLEENARRSSEERPLFVMYDQVYWMLTAGGAAHVDPVSLRPAMAPYTIYVDAISKAFASTGLRVGWAVAPRDIIVPMSDIVSHAGAWAPRAEQVATARFLGDHAAVDTYVAAMRHDAELRLSTAFDGLQSLAREGLPVECVRPQGAIYLSARFALHGMTTPAGATLSSDEDVRRYLLDSAGVAVVPFGAFGSTPGAGWFRLSIGAVSLAQLESAIPRLRSAIAALEGVGAGRG